MTYPQAIDYINRAARFGDKPGLERVRALLGAFGDPHKKLRFVHVAGTNGKGSTCAMVESILRAAGYKTGLFISPYLEDYRERIQVGRRLIPREDIARLAGKAKDIIETLSLRAGGEQSDPLNHSGGYDAPRKFEIETAIALQYFFEQQCDTVVLEVGLGGRLDATNVIEAPEVCVITSISYDHTRILGDSIESIAREKCGILKPGCDAVSCPAQNPSAQRVIEQTCAEIGCRLTVPEERALYAENIGLHGSRFLYKGKRYGIGLIGSHQIQNALTAVETVTALRRRGFAIPSSAVTTGLLSAKWNGRLEIVRKAHRRAAPEQMTTGDLYNHDKRGPLCIIDGAHNTDAVSVLCGVIDSLLCGKKLITVMAMSEDKRYDLCAPMLAKRSAHFIATEFRDMHPLPAAVLAAACRGTHREVIPDVGAAVKRALELAAPDDVVLACGSLYMIGDAKRAMLKGL
ncbi:MAG: bifunctional folylpolyglutamate synthase/dihydrofolate synthase [Oscillospiraceae bacterium]|nr:bifunctional folylpolyglutamate synthase/dihydrofolate synthase [Oscillospiraceae bacterium]